VGLSKKEKEGAGEDRDGRKERKEGIRKASYVKDRKRPLLSDK